MSSPDFYVIAIGLSAGGLKPLQQLLQAIQSPFDAALIVVQHLHRDYKSMAAALLQRYTAIPVLSVSNGMTLQRGHIYVLPENVMMTYHEGHLWLRKRTEKEIINRAIDILMDSMAPELGSRAISIVLSGMDGDGSLGSRHIGEHGGTTIAQLPSTAAQPSMPQGAVTVGRAQYTLAPEAIARFLEAQVNQEK